MKNFIFISPNFPTVYYKFIIALKNKGFNVLGIGDGPYYSLLDELKQNITEYYYVQSLSNFESVKEAVRFFKEKYGEIEYLESNNEFWLMQDAKLREIFDVKYGLRPNEMEHIKYKSKMKECFINAGVKVARYILVDNVGNAKKFIEEVGYPVFVKPDMGVGANESYSINNEDELIQFFNKDKDTQYIMEEYLQGEIVSFDGICDDSSEVIISFNEHFPISNADVVNLDIDDYYYALSKFDDEFLNMGKRVVKSFNIHKRCFHIEFFKLTQDRPGLANKGEIIALEVNMRPPGGNTPDLLSLALNSSFYDCYAEIIANNKLDFELPDKKYVAISVARKDRFNYKYTLEDIINNFRSNFVEHGRYNKEIALAMGDEYFFGKFENIDDAINFKNYIQTKIN